VVRPRDWTGLQLPDMSWHVNHAQSCGNWKYIEIMDALKLN